MKKLKIAFLAGSLLAAASRSAETVAVPRLPPPVFADTEVSTNMPLREWKRGNGVFTTTLTAPMTSTNNVELAFGLDADGDNGLSYQETAFIVGWDCGDWFLDSPQGDFRQTIPATPAADGQPRTLTLHLHVQDGTTTFSVRDGPVPLDFGVGAPAPAWLSPAGLTMLRATERGLGPRTLVSFVRTDGDGTVLILR